MNEIASTPDEAVVGRDRELDVIKRLAAGQGVDQTLLLIGWPGIGKTMLWEAGVRLAREQGVRVLAARPCEAESEFSFSALADLLEDVDVAAMDDVPVPQRHALEVALLRAEAAGRAPELRAVASGLTNVLRAIGTTGRVMIAIDDLQWLDRPSADALAFAARRMPPTVSFLLTERAGRLPAAALTLTPRDVRRLIVGPLDLDAISRILVSRLGLGFPRRIVRQIFDTSGGHPLFAVELGRALAGRDMPEIGEKIPVPGALEEVLGRRIQELPSAASRVLVALALNGDLRTGQAVAIAGADALDEALDHGVVVTEGERIRAAHPLMAAVALSSAKPSERRTLHAELSRIVQEETMRVRHLALAAERADQDLAAALARASASASARGAAHEAVELAQHALRLTPAGHPGRSERVLALAGCLETAGERQQVTRLLTPELPTLSPGAPRVRAWLMLSEGGAIEKYHDHMPHFERALAEARNDPSLRAWVLATMALNTVAEGVERVAEAEGWALEALDAAPRERPQTERLALEALGWARCLQGQAIEDLCDRFRAASDPTVTIMDSPEPVAGLRFAWRGEVQPAREILSRFLSLADERGEAVSYAWLRLNMIELELRTGDWESVARRLDEWAADSDDEGLLIAPTYGRCRALLAAGRGFPAEAESWATPALREAEARGYRWQVLESLRALGVAALLAGAPEQAARFLGRVWEHCRDEGVDDPGAFPVAPDLVQALVELGRTGEALDVTRHLRELATEQAHPWGMATAQRCGAMAALAEHHSDEATAELEAAAAAYGKLGLRFDQARSHFSLGRAARRSKKWGAARRALQLAADTFTDVHSPGWASQARSELARVPARRPLPSDELSPAEQKAAALAADGLSNQQIARRLSVSVHTVEVHLSRAYRKLGIRSRAELGRRLASGN